MGPQQKFCIPASHTVVPPAIANSLETNSRCRIRPTQNPQAIRRLRDGSKGLDLEASVSFDGLQKAKMLGVCVGGWKHDRPVVRRPGIDKAVDTTNAK